MDATAVWVLFLICLPFFMLFWKMLVMGWKSVLLSKRIKHLSDEIEDMSWIPNSPDWAAPVYPSVVGPAVVVYPTNPETGSCVVYAYFVAVLVLVVIAVVIKITISRKRAQTTRTVRQTRARQNPIPTLSRSVDENGSYSHDGPSNSGRDSNEHIKIDLPPTYEQAMTNLNAKELSTTVAPPNAFVETATSQINTSNAIRTDQRIVL